MKIYIEVHCLPLYNFPGEDNPDARAARAKLLLDRHAYLFQNPEVRLFMLPFRILIGIMAPRIDGSHLTMIFGFIYPHVCFDS